MLHQQGQKNNTGVKFKSPRAELLLPFIVIHPVALYNLCMDKFVQALNFSESNIFSYNNGFFSVKKA